MCTSIGSNGALRNSLLRIRLASGPTKEETSYLYNTRPISELGPEEHVCVVEEPVLQADDNELGSFEPVLEQFANVLGMRKI